MSPQNESLNPDGDRFHGEAAAPTDQAISKAVASLGMALGLRIDKQPLSRGDETAASDDPLSLLFRASGNSGISVRETRFRSVGEAFAIVQQGHPVVFANRDGGLLVLERPEGRKVEVSVIADQQSHRTMTKNELDSLLGSPATVRMLVAEKELQCDSMSGYSEDHLSAEHHDHPGPLQRFIELLNLDRRDIGLVVLFAGVAGVLALATPLVIESLVNVVSWGTYFQPLLVLAGMLLTCLGIAGVLKVLQTCVVEIIQRRQFVRIVGDLAHRFPRANQASLEGQYPRELANRVFDIVTIQKASAVLLMDGVSIVLTTILGMILLAFYHPFLLGFDIVLLITMISFMWVLGRGGIRTAINESKTKYAVAHWLQDVISMPSVFKIGGGESLAVRRANQLTVEYVKARKLQFGVVIRQVIFAVSLQVGASTVLLGLGGWLVIDGQLTLGQLVASELVVTVVVGAFAKAGKSLEKFYDLMAGIDKVGHLLDVPPDPRTEIGIIPDRPAELVWSELSLQTPTRESKVAASKIPPGSRVAVVGDDPVGKSLFAKAVAGLVVPHDGMIQVAGFDAFEAAVASAGQLVGYAGPPEVFHGTLHENVDLGRESVTQNRVRETLAEVDLSSAVLSLPDGAKTRLQSNGYPLSLAQQSQLMIARAIATQPRVLVINGLLDHFNQQTRDHVWESIASDGWTLLIITNRDDVAQLCDSQIAIRKQTH